MQLDAQRAAREAINVRSCEHSDLAVRNLDKGTQNQSAGLEDATLSLLEEIDNVVLPELQQVIAGLDKDIVGLVNAAEKVIAKEEVDLAEYETDTEQDSETQKPQQVAESDQTQQVAEAANQAQTPEAVEAATRAHVADLVEKILADEKVIEAVNILTNNF